MFSVCSQNRSAQWAPHGSDDGTGSSDDDSHYREAGADRSGPGDACRRGPAADYAWVVEMIVAVNAALILGMWVRHGGIAAAGGPGGIATAAGQLTGLFGTYG